MAGRRTKQIVEIADVKRRREGEHDLHDEKHGEEDFETMIHGVASSAAYSRRVPGAAQHASREFHECLLDKSHARLDRRLVDGHTISSRPHVDATFLSDYRSGSTKRPTTALVEITGAAQPQSLTAHNNVGLLEMGSILWLFER